ncbi:3-oxoacyl-ACP synthase III family protein [Niabella sp. CJ426]|jgi:3-oxoacyl-[acyl-carrier-protein] synthase-3|uniref:3-oxoacyl-ACP synthase III family protein n=1 Tax=Niabella sp. CJ426 TaxID=3393740 RepID=UPI003D06F129
MQFNSLITGTGAYIPTHIQTNDAFLDNQFFELSGHPIQVSTEITIQKFRDITGITERRYAAAHINTSDMAASAGWQALISSKIDPETLDQIVVAHNFGDVSYDTYQTQNVPSLASKVKHILGIKQPNCIAYDVLAGCPGWLHTVIQSHAWFRAGMARKVLLIGAETLSRVVDSSDRDSMIFGDGAGAVVMEYNATKDIASGILSCCAQTHSMEEVSYINMSGCFKPGDTDTLFMKMKGRKVYEYALKHVPLAMKACLDQGNVSVNDLKKIIIHQANEKMDEEIVQRFYKLYEAVAPENVMPMCIQWLGNSSVATIPTLFHLIRTNQISGHEINRGDIILFASVGAGMNINAVCYRA